jgi:peptidoglycan/LPS O-acetylase OafA/YrhL
MHRIKELDGLRAFAILAVFLVHFRPVDHPIFNFMAFGWVGVDLFFVISGFLITGILLKLRQQPTPFRQFYWRRALRIFPPYYLALSLILLLARVHGEAISTHEQIVAWFFLSSLKGLSVKLMASRLFLQSSFMVAPLPLDFHRYELFERGLRVFWSLSVEELFYLFWAPVVLIGSRRFIAFCSIAPLFLCPVIRALNHTSTFMETANFFARFDSLSMGACLALLFVAVKRGAVSMRVLEWGALIAMPVSTLALALLAWRCGVVRNIQVKSTLAFAVFGYSLIAVLCASIVAVCVRWSDSKATRFFRFEPLAYLGSVSYMMYLIHLPVYVAVGIGLARLGPVPHRQIVQGALGVSLTIGLAAISWKHFESPILRLKGSRVRLFGAKEASPRNDTAGSVRGLSNG